jgi:hypothetical protein
VVGLLEHAVRAVQHLGGADARRDERHDHEDHRPGEAAAQKAPVHLAGGNDVVAAPALLQRDDVQAHEQNERR